MVMDGFGKRTDDGIAGRLGPLFAAHAREGSRVCRSLVYDLDGSGFGAEHTPSRAVSVLSADRRRTRRFTG